MRWRRRAVLRRAVAVGSIAAVPACLGETVDSTAEVRSAAEEFDHLSDVSQALADGFRSRATYVETDDGALGEVFIHERAHEVRSVDDLDPHDPTILFCRLGDDGTYDPVGVGWSIAEDDAATRPELFGREFHEPAAHHVPDQDAHYGLHAWVFDDDVDALFRPTHPSLSAPSFVDALDEARAALDSFRMTDDQAGSDAAQDAGYENTQEHIFTDDGLYGVPFFDATNEGTDPANPPILLYRMTDMWGYELMGAEWYVPTDDSEDRPRMFDQTFHDALPGHSPQTDQPDHYGLHAWLFRANPNGLFSLYNPQFE